MRLLDTTDPRFWNQLEAFASAAQADPALVRRVGAIIAGVRRGGDAALRRYTRKFDGVDVAPARLRVPATELLDAAERATRAERAAFAEAIRCVRAFHRRTLPRNWRARNPHGALVGENFYPLRRVGINVPGGQVPLVSTVIMTCVLAQLAGVREIAVCTPPDKQGGTNPGLLAALSFCGINEVYRVGGVQAMAALAFGTATIPAVDKLCGPGNAYTIEAKRQLYGLVGVDLLPGPSEILALADATANPRWLALDLLAQAEHGTGKERIFLLSTSRSVLNRTIAEVRRRAPAFSSGNHLADVLQKGFLAIYAPTLGEAAAVANFLAPEHLELHVKPSALDHLAMQITTAGAILQGGQTPTVLGDFTAGPSHTLPTGRTGRFFSGLRLTDFLRRSSVVRYDSRSLARAAGVVAAFSALESLPAHGQSLRARLEKR
ncbi:MAG: histidinol dehydrogenase [Opitutales bacterium]